MKYGFIGCGNMGSAIARALSKSTTDIMLTDRTGKAKVLAKSLGCLYTDTETIAESCERIFLAVKPQMMQDVLASVSHILQKKQPLLITMAAGLTTDSIQNFIGAPLPIVRIMPNTPVSIGFGMIPYCCNFLVQKAVLNDFISDMRYAGTLDALEERCIDAATALSGSGPAYMYLFAEALADSAVACGMPADKAIHYAANTMLGAAQMLLTTGEHPGKLKDAVCSPGGSTLAGIKVLEELDLRNTVKNCVIAAYNRNLELGK